MATFAKKIHTRGSNGVEYTTNVYSTPSEAGSQYMQIELDGQTGYAPLVDVSDLLATAGRVTFSNGQTWALGNRGPIPYQYQIITTSGSWTVPADVTKIRVTCVGGGAGGVTNDSYINPCTFNDSPFVPPYSTTVNVSGVYNTCVVDLNYSVAGGTTSFGNLVADGASAPVVGVVLTNRIADSSLPSCSQITPEFLTQYSWPGFVRFLEYHTPSCGYACGTVTTSENVTHGPSTPLVGFNGSILGYAGNGGYADMDNHNWHVAIAGGSGFSNSAYLDVHAGQVFNVSIGVGGFGHYKRHNSCFYTSSYNSDGMGCSSGGNGAVLVEWGVGIE